MTTDKSSVFLVAGNRLLREDLAKLLATKGFNVCGASAWIPDSNSAVAASGAEILVLDSVTARLSDCSFISTMVTQVPNLKEVLIDMDNNREIFLECVRAGAVGYILTGASASEVDSGVQRPPHRHAVCPPELFIHILRPFSRPST